MHLLETLNIFAVRADFMQNFRDYINREIADEVFTLKYQAKKSIVGKGLQTLKPPREEDFWATGDAAVARADDEIVARLDLRARTQVAGSDGGSVGDVVAHTADEAESGFGDVLGVLDLDELYLGLLEYKRTLRRPNLLIRRDELPEILRERCAVVGGGALAVSSYADARRARELAQAALRKYADMLYKRRWREWETAGMEYAPLEREMADEAESAAGCQITVTDSAVKEKVEALLAVDKKSGQKKIYAADNDTIPRLVLDECIYIPLLVEPKSKGILLSPPGLTDSERKFVEALRDYVKEHGVGGCDLFLKRNEGRGKGVGFYEDGGFYPDFILWVKDGARQRIVFVEPHGMLHAPAYGEDPKARLHERVQDLADALGVRDVALDAYIISETPFDELRKHYDDGAWTKEKFAERHILFAEDGKQNIATILAASCVGRTG